MNLRWGFRIIEGEDGQEREQYIVSKWITVGKFFWKSSEFVRWISAVVFVLMIDASSRTEQVESGEVGDYVILVGNGGGRITRTTL